MVSGVSVQVSANRWRRTENSLRRRMGPERSTEVTPRDHVEIRLRLVECNRAGASNEKPAAKTLKPACAAANATRGKDLTPETRHPTPKIKPYFANYIRDTTLERVASRKKEQTPTFKKTN
jgi:hypothetical protein